MFFFLIHIFTLWHHFCFLSGELPPGTSVRCPLQLLALVAGLHELRGCTVADMHTAQEFPQGKLTDVLVEFPPDDDRGEEVEAEVVVVQ